MFKQIMKVFNASPFVIGNPPFSHGTLDSAKSRTGSSVSLIRQSTKIMRFLSKTYLKLARDAFIIGYFKEI